MINQYSLDWYQPKVMNSSDVTANVERDIASLERQREELRYRIDNLQNELSRTVLAHASVQGELATARKTRDSIPSLCCTRCSYRGSPCWLFDHEAVRPDNVSEDEWNTCQYCGDCPSKEELR